MSALHVTTSHFYHDSYFRRFRSVYNLTLLLMTFCLWFVVVEVATQLPLQARAASGDVRKNGGSC